MQYSEIPNSGYQIEALDDDETGQPDNHPEKVLDIGGGMDGEYIVQVIGTGTGTYDLDVMRVDEWIDPELYARGTEDP